MSKVALATFGIIIVAFVVDSFPKMGGLLLIAIVLAMLITANRKGIV